jgi:hypothetical protein
LRITFWCRQLAQRPVGCGWPATARRVYARRTDGRPSARTAPAVELAWPLSPVRRLAGRGPRLARRRARGVAVPETAALIDLAAVRALAAWIGERRTLRPS